MNPEAVVVGAGAAGVAAAACLAARGVETLILEEARPARSWWSRYEGLHLNTVRWMSDLPGYRMHRRYGRWPSRRDWAEYVSRYADAHRLNIKTDTPARRIERAGDLWRVITPNTDIICRFVVIATGHDRVPSVPAWPGVDRYAGKLIHAADYRSAHSFLGQDILVVGGGNTGTEIATQLAQAGAEGVRLSVRTPPLVFPRSFAGVPVTVWGAAAALLPDSMLDRAGVIAQRTAFGDLSSFGVGGDHRPLSRMRYEYYAPVVESGFVDALKKRKIEVVAPVRRFDVEEVVMDDESRVRCDGVIAATGHVPGLELLVGHLGVLSESGEPLARGGFSPLGAAGLFFAGFRAGLVALLPYLELDAREIAQSVVHARAGGAIPEMGESEPISGPRGGWHTAAVLGHALSTRVIDLICGRFG